MQDDLKQELIRDEGLRLDAYKDSVGLYTIGVGHLLGDSMRMEKITNYEAMALLEADIHVAWDLVDHLLGRTVFADPDEGPNWVRERALINMAFNLGNRLAGFKKFIAAVKAQDWDTAAAEMLNSKWATQVGDRAGRLAFMIRTGGTL